MTPSAKHPGIPPLQGSLSSLTIQNLLEQISLRRIETSLPSPRRVLPGTSRLAGGSPLEDGDDRMEQGKLLEPLLEIHVTGGGQNKLYCLSK